MTRPPVSTRTWKREPPCSRTHSETPRDRLGGRRNRRRHPARTRPRTRHRTAARMRMAHPRRTRHLPQRHRRNSTHPRSPLMAADVFYLPTPRPDAPTARADYVEAALAGLVPYTPVYRLYESGGWL